MMIEIWRSVTKGYDKNNKALERMKKQDIQTDKYIYEASRVIYARLYRVNIYI